MRLNVVVALPLSRRKAVTGVFASKGLMQNLGANAEKIHSG